ncbi:thermonuclease family protein [Phenylobacterium sp. J367]|uniref:thermonuclease family protein n=1 Tax=Phenylobacterium sp. J367 TaxID=2898435 RepID=UPI002150D72C|nr:thermonuclease family protein [Phenylobacterium sp. J367]MCR5879370.1 thermonuclease family protein [Phenylobacterium sp. J367]
MRLRLVLLPLAVAAALAGCDRPEPPPEAAPRPPEPALTERVKVLNADVLVVDGQHIRLAGVWAPQPIPDARCWAEALAAREATARMREIIQQGSEITVAPSAAKDAYNRTITHVTVDRLDLSDALAERGLAAVSDRYRFGWCEPISTNEPGAPPMRSLMDFGR